MSKVFSTPSEAVQDIGDGASILISGLGAAHNYPTSLIRALRDRGSLGLTVICNLLGLADTSSYVLAENGQIRKLVASFGGYAGYRTTVDDQIESGQMEFEVVPQGILCERVRAGGAGIPAFYSPTGLGTIVESGKERRVIDGREYLLEKAITADFAFITAHKADTMGNLAYRRSARNFAPTFATAAKTTIAEVEEIVEPGEIDPDMVVTPGIYVDRIVKTEIDRRRIALDWKPLLAKRFMVGGPIERPGMKQGLTRELIALRAARELHGGQWVNLGVGLPSLMVQFIPEDVWLHTEMGLLAYGPPPATDEETDSDVMDASSAFMTVRPGTSICSNLEAFAMARGGRVDTVVLGAFQVSEKGDLANIASPSMGAPGVGGAMDLVVGESRLIIAMEHLTNKGEPKIVAACDYPLTAPGCVSMIITDLAVIEVTAGGLVLKEVAPGWTPEEVQAVTAAPLTVSPDWKEMSL